LFGFTKKSSDSIFAGILKNGNHKSLFDSFSKKTGITIDEGLYVDRSIFISIDKLIFEGQIHTKGDYSGIPQKSLTEISKVITAGSSTKELEDGDNVVFIPKLGKSKVVTSLKDTKLKHQNLFKVELNKKYALADYVMYYLNTDKGIAYRELIHTGSTIKFISRNLLELLVIFLPTIKEQKELLGISIKIDVFIDKLKELKKNLAYNPKQSNEINLQLNKFAEKLETFSEEEKILNTIKEGENYFIEFKETYAFDKKSNEKRADYLIHSAVKNINAFINSKGGQLFIGVNDDGEITGLKDEISKWKSLDDFMLYFTDTVKSRIGSFLNTHLDYRIHTINKKKILIVECKASEKKPSFIVPPYKGKDFFVRTNPAAQPLDGNDRFEYIKDRFK
ncbi:putative DNA binding domain-containing protein, partial [Flavobacteriaceae bacterium]|nr:putative DNA binding domain-containing protein [Flavobacteriaceae bacterium]